MRPLLSVAFVALFAVAALAEDAKPGPLFNGKDLTGWKTKAGESLAGKSEAFNGRFKVVEGVLVLDPAVKGDVVIETADAISGDAKITFEFRPDAKCNNDLFLRGAKFDIKKEDVKTLKLGEWNTFEIIAKGNQIEFRANGETIRTMAAKGDSSSFGIRAEFGALDVRKLVLAK